MASLQTKLEAMQLAQQRLEEENAALRDGRRLAPRQRSGVAVEEDEEDEQEREDRLAREGYAAAKAALFEALSAGKMPSAAQYLERDVHMYRLSDSEIQAEYNWYTQVGTMSMSMVVSIRTLTWPCASRWVGLPCGGDGCRSARYG